MTDTRSHLGRVPDHSNRQEGNAMTARHRKPARAWKTRGRWGT